MDMVSSQERKRLLKIVRILRARGYQKLKELQGEEFVKTAKHLILVTLQHRYEYFEHYIERLAAMRKDIFLAQVELMKVPYKIKWVKVHYRLEDVRVVLEIFQNVERELRKIVKPVPGTRHTIMR